MDHRHGDVRPLLLQRAGGGGHCLQGGGEFERRGIGQERRRLQRGADHADTDPAPLQHERIGMMGQDRVIGVAQIGGEHGEARLAHALEIDLWPEIELVIAGDEDIRGEFVEERHHMRPLVEARHEAGAEGVARMGEDDIGALGPLRLHHGGEARQAAPAPILVHLVDVIHQHEGQPHGVGGLCEARAHERGGEDGAAALEGAAAV